MPPDPKIHTHPHPPPWVRSRVNHRPLRCRFVSLVSMYQACFNGSEPNGYKMEVILLFATL